MFRKKKEPVVIEPEVKKKRKPRKKAQYRITKVSEWYYMPEKLWLWITPDSYWCLVETYANLAKRPCTYNEAIAIIKLDCSPIEKREVVYKWNGKDLFIEE